jgi:hypothetical protein
VLATLGDDRARALSLATEPDGQSRQRLERRFHDLDRLAEWADREDDIFNVEVCFWRLLLSMARPPADSRQPLFMRTDSYRDRGLAAALATWAGHREISGPCMPSSVACEGVKFLPGVADPNLEAWRRFIYLWISTERAFKEAGVHMERDSLEAALEFQATADRQLRGEKLGKADAYRFLHHYIWLIENTREDGDDGHKQVPLDRRLCVSFARMDPPGQEKVRWAGKACCPIYAVVEYGGALMLCKGGVFDYREFDLPPGKALTREEFRKLMDSPDAPPPPEWTKSYRYEPPAHPDRPITRAAPSGE